MSPAKKTSAPEGLRLEVDARAFTAQLATVVRACSTRTTVEILRGVRLEASDGSLLASATNLDWSLRSRIPAEVASHGSIVLANAKGALALLKTLDGPLTLADGSDERAGELVVMSWTGAEYRFPAHPVEDFPHWPTLDGPSGTVDREAFCQVLERVLPAVSADESRPVLSGMRLLLDGESSMLRAVATDSYRLAVDETEGSCDGVTLEETLPGGTLAEVLKLARKKGAGGEIAYAASTPDPPGHSPLHYGFTVGETEVSTRRIDGQYPNYAQLRPDNYTLEATIDAAELLGVAKRVAAVVGRTHTPVRLHVDSTSGAVRLSAVMQDGSGASETLPTPAGLSWLKVKGESKDAPEMPECGFNAAFLVEAVRFCGETVRLRLLSPLRPALFLPAEGDTAWHLLMPIRLVG